MSHISQHIAQLTAAEVKAYAALLRSTGQQAEAEQMLDALRERLEADRAKAAAELSAPQLEARLFLERWAAW